MSLLIVSPIGYCEMFLEKHHHESENNFMTRVRHQINSYIPFFELVMRAPNYIVCGEKMAHFAIDCEQNDIAALLLYQLSGFVGVINGKIAIFFNQQAFEARKFAIMLLELYSVQHLQLFSRIAKSQ